MPYGDTRAALERLPNTPVPSGRPDAQNRPTRAANSHCVATTSALPYVGGMLSQQEPISLAARTGIPSSITSASPLRRLRADLHRAWDWTPLDRPHPSNGNLCRADIPRLRTLRQFGGGDGRSRLYPLRQVFAVREPILGGLRHS